MYEAIVYFEGPLSKWAGKPDEREVIWRHRSRWLGAALGRARTRCRGLAHCLWLVRDAQGDVVAGELPVRASL